MLLARRRKDGLTATAKLAMKPRESTTQNELECSDTSRRPTQVKGCQVTRLWVPLMRPVPPPMTDVEESFPPQARLLDFFLVKSDNFGRPMIGEM